MTSTAETSEAKFVQVIETPTCILGMDKNLICHMTYHPDAQVTIEEMKVIEQALLQLSNNGPMKIMMDMRNRYIHFDGDARKYAATAPVTKKFIAEAVLLNNLPSRLLFNFFLKFDRPQFPIRAFSDEEAAMEWLHKKSS